jgi:uncharacterized protein YggE
MENIKNNVWKIGLVVGVLLSLFLLTISIKELKSIAYVGKAESYTNIISVTGTGEVVSIPDVATVSFTVTENAKVISDVQSKASEKINKVIASLKQNGIEEKNIKTTSYSINPHYDYIQGECNQFICPPGKSVLSGYDVSQSIEVKIRDLKNAGKILETIGSLNVQNVGGLMFTIDDINKVKAQARDKAIESAQTKAKELSKKLGVKLVRVTGFYDSSEEQYYARETMVADGYSATPAKMTVAPQLPQGEQKVTARINISYEIR